jgi:hypothetical protein
MNAISLGVMPDGGGASLDHGGVRVCGPDADAVKHRTGLGAPSWPPVRRHHPQGGP